VASLKTEELWNLDLWCALYDW